MKFPALAAFSFLLLLLTLFALVPSAPACELAISLDCSLMNGAGTCHATTHVESGSCSGFIYSGMFTFDEASTVVMRNATSNGPFEHCFSSEDIQDQFPWAVCFGNGTLSAGQSFTVSADVSGASADIPIEAFIAVLNEEFELAFFATTFDTIEVATCVPDLAAPGTVPSGLTYEVVWTAVSQPGATYEIQESTSPNFDANVVTRTVTDLETDFVHTVSQTTTFYYRVRATSCGGVPGEFSSVTWTVVTPPAPPESPKFDLVVPLGTTQQLIQQIFVASPGGVTTTFTASVDRPWLTVSPSSGTIGPSGVTLTLFANPAELPVGATTGTVTVSFGAGKTALSNHTKSIPVSVTLVTPVGSGGKTNPAQNSLLIPAVAHVAGGAFFQSDVRLGNATSQRIDYELFFTPSNTDGTVNGKKTTIRLEPGQTAALNDIVKNFFGYAAPTDSIGGALEIRPLRTSSAASFASSRTYATTPLGTLGQFVPGVPFPEFIGNPVALPGQAPGPSVRQISLQQLSQSAAFRTNIGLLEATGLGATGRLVYYNPSGQVIGQLPFTLGPAEHRQYNVPLAALGTPIADARVEVVVDETSPGRVTAYASVIDNVTQDPFLVAPTRPSQIASNRFILPGVAAVDNPGASNFYSDVRAYNAGTSPVTATVRYVPLTGFSVGAGATTQVTIQPGEVKAWDNALKALFNLDGTGGALHFETPAASSLVVTGRTYSRAAAGTYGQFIPALLPTEGTALGERPIEVLQLEQSTDFRTNLGLIELTGKPVSIRITASVPEARVTPSVDLTLQGNEFRQYNSFLQSVLNLGNIYNGRISVSVTGGEGRIAAYASVIDNRTSDPTYVPGQ